MNREQVEGNWKQHSGKLREKWGQLTNSDFQRIAGKRDRLVGRIHEAHGIAEEEAEKQVREFETSLEASKRTTRH